jgi:hypothetical protein
VVGAMLQRLGEYISACLQRADECRNAAASETDDRVRSQLLDLEQQWQHLAKSYEFIETLERFLLDQHNNSLPPEVEKLPKDFPPE